jgi:hypothetical protein
MGDIHQPLHCAERDNDKGGDTRLVFYPGQHRAVKLHAVWDTWILKDMMGSHRVADYADMLGGVITSSQKKEWVKGNPEAWRTNHTASRWRQPIVTFRRMGRRRR